MPRCFCGCNEDRHVNGDVCLDCPCTKFTPYPEELETEPLVGKASVLVTTESLSKTDLFALAIVGGFMASGKPIYDSEEKLDLQYALFAQHAYKLARLLSAASKEGA